MCVQPTCTPQLTNSYCIYCWASVKLRTSSVRKLIHEAGVPQFAMPQGEQDMSDSMGSTPGHLPDVANTQALVRAVDRSSFCSSRRRQQLKSLGLAQL